MWKWLNPWREMRRLEDELYRCRFHIQQLEQSLDLHSDRYDKIRETNLQLRDALNLYRRSGM